MRIVESGSLSAAARQLGVSPSAISKTMSRLEARLGVQLLQRSTDLVEHLRRRGIQALVAEVLPAETNVLIFVPDAAVPLLVTRRTPAAVSQP